MAVPQADVQCGISGRFVESKSGWIESIWKSGPPRRGFPLFTDGQLQALARQARQTSPGTCSRYFAPLVGVTYGRITIRSQHTLWGELQQQGKSQL